MTAWEGPGCNNHAERYGGCGCSATRGYKFVYQGQTTALYDQAGCHGGCFPFGWQSTFI
ncbi:unnamed protein product [Spirodela intermedia]|uniref:Uncharacterized protein n=1 Tax=Spirodela intermedia TaxID=51605 RepID=A0A7I8L2S5_SPIIN|nr:unnamed protein product [Spirodela intermedia]